MLRYHSSILYNNFYINLFKYMSKYKPHFHAQLKKDRNYRFSELIINNKELILKNKFNQAYDNMHKYYLQNKNNINNEEVYEIGWQCLRSITKKIYRRLTNLTKRSIESVTQYHLDHLYSIYLSVYLIVQPEITNIDPSFFLNLNVTSELLNLSNILKYNIIFQRKKPEFFLRSEKMKVEVHNLVEYYLKILNITLIYKSKRENNPKEMAKVMKSMQKIYDGYKEYMFPLEFMDFSLIKLSLMEEGHENINAYYKYELPLGFLNKLYNFIRNDNQTNIAYYIKKLNSYMTLSFKNASMSIPQMYIAAREMMHVYIVVERIHSFKERQEREKQEHASKMLKMKRMVTIDLPDSQDDDKLRITTSNGIDMQFSSNKMHSEKGLLKIENQLKTLSNKAIHKIDSYINNQKEIKYIILSYYEYSYLKRVENHKQNLTFTIAKDIQINKDVNLLPPPDRKKSKVLSPLDLFVNSPNSKNQKNNLINGGKKHKKLNLDDKFIVKNITLVNKSIKKKQEDQNLYYKVIENLSINSIEMINQSDSDEDGELKHNFQVKRRKAIKQYNQTTIKKNISSDVMVKKSLNQQRNAWKESQQHQKQITKDRQRSFESLDDIIQFVIMKQMEAQPIIDNDKTSIPKEKLKIMRKQTDNLAMKLQNLHQEVREDNLHTKRLIEQLQLRNNTPPRIQNSQQMKNQDLHLNLKGKDSFQRIQDLQYSRKVTRNLDSNGKKQKVQNIKVNKNKTNSKFQLNKPKIKLQLKGRQNPMKDVQMTIQIFQKALKLKEKNSQQNFQPQNILLSCTYDNLRRDLTKKSLLQNNTKTNNNKKQCKTILEVSYDDKVIQK